MKLHKTAARRARDVAHREFVGANLRMAREVKGASRRDWTLQFGVAANMQSQWESGANYPDLFFLIRLCEDYGLTMDWFYRGDKSGVISSLSSALSPAFGGTWAA